MAKHVPVHIVADHREKPSGVPDLLAQLGVNLEISELPVGDYVIEDRVVVERKTIGDFAASIVDTRLFRQASQLMRSSYRSAFLLEGLTSTARVPREAMQGALLTVMLVFDIPVIRAMNQEESARLLLYAARQLADSDRARPVRRARKPKRPWARRLHILESLPGVGRSKAEALLKTFGSIEAVFRADEDALAEVAGISRKSARSIRELVTDASCNERHHPANGFPYPASGPVPTRKHPSHRG